MSKHHITATVLFFIAVFSFAQEQLVPLGNSFRDGYLLQDNGNGQVFMGDGLFPVTEGQTGYVYHHDTLNRSSRKWFGRKLLREHFVEIRGEDYFLSIDPLINLNYGREVGIEERTLFTNTRAFQVSGEVLGKVSFYTAFHENQARFASFQSAYFDERGEKRLNALGEYYDENATIPAGGRTKPFLEDAYDFAASSSHIRANLHPKFTVQFGNTPNFIGWGYRSMLLSDNSFYATTLRMEYQITEKLRFTRMNAKHLNLFRRQFTNKVEAPYEKKNYSANYLTYSFNDKLVLGLFESQVYFREDSVQSQWMHPLYFNPIPFLNAAVFGWENSDAKSLVGANIGYRILPKTMLYGQVVFDEELGYQVGIRANDFIKVPKLFAQLEWNQASGQLYAARNRRMAYTHFNFPLAHPLGNGFSEIIARWSYQWKGIYLESSSMLYTANQSIENKTNLFGSKNVSSEIDEHTVLFQQVELGYVFNPRTNLSVFGQLTYRASDGQSTGNRNTGIIQVGIKTRINNQYFDF